MSRQEQRAKLLAKVDTEYQTLLNKAMDVVDQNAAKRANWKRPPDMTKPQWEMACAVRVLRDGGVAWWQVAHSLGLPGSGGSATTGKSGAGLARRLYAKAFGQLPEGVRASSKGSHTRAASLAGALFAPDATDDEIVKAVLGQKIVWRIVMRDATGTAYLEKEDEAVVSPAKAVVLDRLGNSGPVLRFNSVLPSGDSGNLSWYPGPERTVRVESILSVVLGMPTGARVLK